jgi:hypothetical protein
VRDKGTEIELYAQEPAFTPLDHEFLSLLSIDVCTDDIATHITPRSLVFSPFVDWYILLPIFLKGKDPVLYVGNEILDDYGAFAQSEEKRVKLEECNESGRNWLGKRGTAKLREFEMHPHALNGMVVYWVERGEEDATEDEGSGQQEGDEETRETDEHKIPIVEDEAGGGTGQGRQSANKIDG